MPTPLPPREILRPYLLNLPRFLYVCDSFSHFSLRFLHFVCSNCLFTCTFFLFFCTLYMRCINKLQFLQFLVLAAAGRPQPRLTPAPRPSPPSSTFSSSRSPHFPTTGLKRCIRDPAQATGGRKRTTDYKVQTTDRSTGCGPQAAEHRNI